MSNGIERELRLGDYKVKTGPGYAKIGPHARDGEYNELTVVDLGELAEWLAEAWENTEGKAYEPEYVGEPVERDCE